MTEGSLQTARVTPCGSRTAAFVKRQSGSDMPRGGFVASCITGRVAQRSSRQETGRFCCSGFISCLCPVALRKHRMLLGWVVGSRRCSSKTALIALGYLDQKCPASRCSHISCTADIFLGVAENRGTLVGGRIPAQSVYPLLESPSCRRQTRHP